MRHATYIEAVGIAVAIVISIGMADFRFPPEINPQLGTEAGAGTPIAESCVPSPSTTTHPKEQ